MLHNKGYDTWVDASAASTHHQTIRRSQAHRGVEDLAIAYSCDRSAIADVAGDDAGLVKVLLKDLTSTMADVAVARAVEAVTTYPVLLIVLVR